MFEDNYGCVKEFHVIVETLASPEADYTFFQNIHPSLIQVIVIVWTMCVILAFNIDFYDVRKSVQVA